MKRRLSRGLTGGATAAMLIASACISSTGPLEVVTWEAALVGADGIADPLAGSVAMVIGESQTQIGISVTDAPHAASLAWDVRDGTCAMPGGRVGPASVYAAIAVSDTGNGASETVVFRRIGTAGPYAAFVYDGTPDSGAVLACADLERRR